MTNYVDFVKSVESTSWHQPNERLLHAAMGLCTEVAELFEVEDDQHELEEIGDVLWYLALAHDVLGLQWEIDGDIVINARGDGPLDGLTIYATELLDMVKKQIFYGKPLNEEKAKEAILAIKIILLVAMDNDESPFTFDDAVEANVRKLKRRYPEKFTEEAAVNRDVKAEYAAMNG